VIAKLFWHDYRYFPYERYLARREVQSVLDGKFKEDEFGIVVSVEPKQLARISRLTYFKGIEFDSQIIIPDQANLESSVNGDGEALFPGMSIMPALKRQSTRYSAHGLHEYRGKFNPQVVRAIGNLLGLDEGDWVLDPFCGSGTTMLEAAHIGWNCVGLDVNPLGVLIANTKITAFKTSPSLLREETDLLIHNLTGKYYRNFQNWENELLNINYLASWFTEPVLKQLAFILSEISHVRTQKLQNVYRVILSDLCRDVSLQDPSDLRIRRRKNIEEINDDVISEFISSLCSKLDPIFRARKRISPKQTRQKALLADCRTNKAVRSYIGDDRKYAFDAAITSPPYATALPYVDTQRLSICLLGLVQSKDIRALERSLIGNREISDKERIYLEQLLQKNAAHLPDEVFVFCKELFDLADYSNHGFRKRNMPALVFYYLWQMAEMFEAVRSMIRRGGKYGLLVGSNKTTLREREIIIDTPQLLASLAESRGWIVEEQIPFETYQRFDVHKKNSIRREMLLILRNSKSK